jgi:hypothetical protein
MVGNHFLYIPTDYFFSRTIPLSLLSVGGSKKAEISQTAVLSKREQFFALDTSKPFKLNAGTTGPCKIYRLRLLCYTDCVQIVCYMLRRDLRRSLRKLSRKIQSSP